MGWTGWACSGSHALARALGALSPAALLPVRSKAGSAGCRKQAALTDEGRRQGLGAGAGWRPGKAAEPGLRKARVSAVRTGSQDPGTRVPWPPPSAKLRPGSQNSEIFGQRREFGLRKEDKRQAKHPSKGPRKQLLLELGWRFLQWEREGASATGKPVFATFDCPPQNIIQTKCLCQDPTFLQPLKMEC